ncbi:MAG: hypothetical protein KatS3mg081_2641 [Gemmatimonadales bacterium]|nr:MAG: hypothetical protein KatS3mg081_2641 [Gemmatimonadales bacterium]
MRDLKAGRIGAATFTGVLVLLGLHGSGQPSFELRGTLSAAQDSAAVVREAERWLRLLDEERHAEALDSAAPLLRQMARSPQSWAAFLSEARAGLLPPFERRLVASDPNPDLPAAPPGRYWALTFELARSAVRETVVLQQVGESWRVAMYRIQRP